MYTRKKKEKKIALEARGIEVVVPSAGPSCGGCPAADKMNGLVVIY